jgi:hypothetical protein
MKAIDALHTGRILSLKMRLPFPRAELDADTGRVLVVARIIDLNSLELEVWLFLVTP